MLISRDDHAGLESSGNIPAPKLRFLFLGLVKLEAEKRSMPPDGGGVLDNLPMFLDRGRVSRRPLFRRVAA
jgi:hypothetical protein